MLANAVVKRRVDNRLNTNDHDDLSGTDESSSGVDNSKLKGDIFQILSTSFNVRRNMFKLFSLVLALLSSAVITFIFGMLSDVHQTSSNYTRKTMVVSTPKEPTSRNPDPDISVVILTYKKHELLRELLPSVIRQNPLNFEVIIVDNGCLPKTKEVISEAFGVDSRAVSIPYTYLPLCANPGYAVGNNMGVEVSNKQSNWTLFLNDDVILQGENFISNMMNLVEIKTNAGGVVCKLLTEGGEEVIEAGSIVWSDGGALGFARGEAHVDASYITFAKPVDYGSGACLMVRKDLFSQNGGFDHKKFPNYYEDTDLQMQIQHRLGKEIWFQPTAVAHHAEHGTFTKDDAKKLMKKSSKRFVEKWKIQLQAKHLQNPHRWFDHDKELQLMRASDLRARDPSKANILWLEQAAPNPGNGSGFGRAFDNLSIVAELGHKITVVVEQKLSASWCNKKCRENLSDIGVEMVAGHWEDYVNKYIEFFDIVYISRPSIFKMTYRKWQDLYKKHSFTLVYDCEALWYRRDELLFSLIQKEDVFKFPGGMEYFSLMESKMDAKFIQLEVDDAKHLELSLIQMADSVLTVSETERQIIVNSLPEVQTYTVGHIMSIDETRVTKNNFSARNGILFLASFNDNMYYNGDAIWHFLSEVYPLVLKESKSRIPLTIAGRNIPKELRDLVEDQKILSETVVFRESVPDIMELYNDARIFIAPHLYGAGIQYKVSEAFSLGLPIVMSKFTADGFGIKAEDKVGCVGESSKEMKDCILEMNSSAKKWDMIRENQLEYIRRTHKRVDLVGVWDDIIETNFKKIMDRRREGDSKKMEHNLLKTQLSVSTKECPEGEKHYSLKYPNVKKAVDAGQFRSYFKHYQQHGQQEGKRYVCYS